MVFSPRNISIKQPKHVLLQTVIKIGHENIGLILWIQRASSLFPFSEYFEFVVLL